VSWPRPSPGPGAIRKRAIAPYSSSCGTKMAAGKEAIGARRGQFALKAATTPTRQIVGRKQTALMGMIEETSILKLMTISASVFIRSRVQFGVLLCIFQWH
jgi:hypothetical protein